MQAGSSIMPGKINPFIPEVVNQVAFEVIGNDVTISFAAEAGQLQLKSQRYRGCQGSACVRPQSHRHRHGARPAFGS
ncbi:MAG: hypothetical protein ABT05_07470 [Lautropia sp. SCN 66-9]|nr:MAG: hypothetical protein ABT05_07470 [Lautropia sp. SCN 66-9]